MSSSNQINQPVTTLSHSLPVNSLTDKGISLTLNIDPSVPGNDERISEFKTVAATGPRSVQDFLIRLNELQKQKSSNK